MACLNVLKQEIRTLESVFSKNHERFQIVSASVDELNCKFIGKNGKRYEIHANITETYPSTPPVWFADSEETSVTNAVQILSNTSGRDNHVMNQVSILVRELCRLHSVSEPAELERLSMGVWVAHADSTGPDPQDMDEDDDDDENDDDEDLHLDMDESEILAKNKAEEMDVEHINMLERLRQNQRQDYLKGQVSGSVQATDRLMKELRDIYRSDSFKKDGSDENQLPPHTNQQTFREINHESKISRCEETGISSNQLSDPFQFQCVKCGVKYLEDTGKMKNCDNCNFKYIGDSIVIEEMDVCTNNTGEGFKSDNVVKENSIIFKKADSSIKEIVTPKKTIIVAKNSIDIISKLTEQPIVDHKVSIIEDNQESSGSEKNHVNRPLKSFDLNKLYQELSPMAKTHNIILTKTSNNLSKRKKLNNGNPATSFNRFIDGFNETFGFFKKESSLRNSLKKWSKKSKPSKQLKFPGEKEKTEVQEINLPFLSLFPKKSSNITGIPSNKAEVCKQNQNYVDLQRNFYLPDSGLPISERCKATCVKALCDSSGGSTIKVNTDYRNEVNCRDCYVKLVDIRYLVHENNNNKKLATADVESSSCKIMERDKSYEAGDLNVSFKHGKQGTVIDDSKMESKKINFDCYVRVEKMNYVLNDGTIKINDDLQRCIKEPTKKNCSNSGKKKRMRNKRKVENDIEAARNTNCDENYNEGNKNVIENNVGELEGNNICNINKECFVKLIDIGFINNNKKLATADVESSSCKIMERDKSYEAGDLNVSFKHGKQGNEIDDSKMESKKINFDCYVRVEKINYVLNDGTIKTNDDLQRCIKEPTKKNCSNSGKKKRMRNKRKVENDIEAARYTNCDENNNEGNKNVIENNVGELEENNICIINKECFVKLIDIGFMLNKHDYI